ncbi:MAG: hypothetical protein ACP6IU_14885 [Candidatus Asgardarchaeia archaeon]
MVSQFVDELDLNELQIILNNLNLLGAYKFVIHFDEKIDSLSTINVKIDEEGTFVEIDYLSNIIGSFFNREDQRSVLIKAGILKLPFVETIKKAMVFEDLESFRPVALTFDTNVFYLRLITQHILRTPPLNKYDPTKLLMFYSRYVGDEIQSRLDRLKSKYMYHGKHKHRNHNDLITLQKAIKITSMAMIELNELIHEKRIQRFGFKISKKHSKEIAIKRGDSNSDIHDNYIVEAYRKLMKYRQYNILFLTSDINCASAAQLSGLNVIFIDQEKVEPPSGFRTSLYEFRQFIYTLTYTVLKLRLTSPYIPAWLEVLPVSASPTLHKPKVKINLISENKTLIKAVKQDLETYRNVTGVLKK